MKRTVSVLLLIGLVHAVAYCWALRVPGGVGFACIDQTCYAQAARRIAEGCPFSFSPGQPATTGQSSVLYPFLLAVPAAFGAAWNSLNAASAVLAVLFYLTFLSCWGSVVVRLFPSGSVSRVAAVLMLGASGICGYAPFTMTDQGLWMAVSAGLAAALVWEKRGLTRALLCLAPWVRPEGMMLVVAVTGVEGVSFFRQRRGKDPASTGRFPFASLLPLLSLLGVFALNCWLTGRVQFSSVAHKGYFKMMPFGMAAAAFGNDLWEILSAYLFSIPDSWFRFFSMTSPVVVVGFWIGVFASAFRRGLRGILELRLLPFVLAAVLAVLSVASGGFSGLDFDRYLAWMMPLVFLAAAVGIDCLCRWIRVGFGRRLLLAVLAVTVLVSTVEMVMMMRRTVGPRTRFFDEVRAEAAHLPVGAKVGAVVFHWAYALPPSARFQELLGIFTPAFFGCRSVSAAAMELLKHDPSLRFDYWMGAYAQDDKADTPRCLELLRRERGELLIPGSGHRYVRRADWSAYDRANESPIPGREPVARLDIAYAPDEQAAGLWAEDGSCIYCDRLFCSGKRASDGLPMCDGGVRTSRGHGFSLDVRPGKPAVLVLRTAGLLEELVGDLPDEHPVRYGSSAKVRVLVGGRPLGEYEIPLREDVFTDYRIDVPAEFLASARTAFRVEGRFAAFGYWLYQ